MSKVQRSSTHKSRRKPSHDTAGSGGFWTFKKMITPVLIQALFWIESIACVIVGCVMLDSEASVPMGLALIFLGPVAVRVKCELLIIFFKMYDSLTEILQEIKREEKTKDHDRLKEILQEIKRSD